MQDRIRISLGIRGRLILWFVLGAVGAVVFGSIVVYASGLASIQGTLGQTYCQIASRAVEQFEDHFFSESAVVQNIATDVLTTEVLLEEGEVYHKRTADWIDARLRRQTREWTAAEKESERKSILHRQLSHRLSILAGLGDSLRRLAVYDSFGVLHAANLPPAERVAAAHPWFKSVDGQSSHFVYSDLDTVAGVLTIVIPVWGGVEIVGYVLAEYDYAGFSRGLGEIRFGATGEAMLVNAAGMPLTDQSRAFLGSTLMRAVPSESAAVKGGGAAAGTPIGWPCLTTRGGRSGGGSPVSRRCRGSMRCAIGSACCRGRW